MRTRTRRTKRGQTGGARASVALPGVTDGASFEKAAELIYIGAHGNSHPTETVKVPSRTYILFFSPAGESCGGKQTAAFQQYLRYGAGFKPKTEDSFWQTWYNIISGEERPTDTGIPLYDPGTKPKKRNIATYKSTSIYEPGDTVPELLIDFRNHLGANFIDIGAYKMPVASDYLALMKRIHAAQEKFIVGGNSSGGEGFELHPASGEIVQDMYNSGSASYNNRKDNLYNTQYLKTANTVTMLSRLLIGKSGEGAHGPIFPPIPEGKVRFILLFACRNLKPMPFGMEETYKQLLRRNSLTQRVFRMVADAAGGGGAGAAAGEVAAAALEAAMEAKAEGAVGAAGTAIVHQAVEELVAGGSGAVAAAETTSSKKVASKKGAFSGLKGAFKKKSVAAPAPAPAASDPTSAAATGP